MTGRFQTKESGKRENTPANSTFVQYVGGIATGTAFIIILGRASYAFTQTWRTFLVKTYA